MHIETIKNAQNFPDKEFCFEDLLENVTPAERALIPLIVAGMKDRQMASFLGLTVGTIRQQIKCLLRKTGFPCKLTLALAAALHGDGYARAFNIQTVLAHRAVDPGLCEARKLAQKIRTNLQGQQNRQRIFVKKCVHHKAAA